MNDNSTPSSESENSGVELPGVMREMKARILLACRLFRCALLHGMVEHMLGYRCTACKPVRKRSRSQIRCSTTGKEESQIAGNQLEP